MLKRNWQVKILVLACLSLVAFGVAIANPVEVSPDDPFESLQAALTAQDWQNSDRLTRELIADEMAVSPYYPKTGRVAAVVPLTLFIYNPNAFIAISRPCSIESRNV